MKKLLNYLSFVTLFFLPLLFYHVVDTSGWRSNSDIHAMLEFASALMAITVGVMVLLHFFTTGRRFFLIVSIGFFLIGVEEFIHAIFSFSRIWLGLPETFKLAISTTWLSGQFILVTSFYIAIFYRERHIVEVKRGRYAIVFIIIGVIFATFVSLLIFNLPSLPDFVQLGSIAKKLIELSLALLYFIAFILYFRIFLKQQSQAPLLWSIIACLILRILVHIFVFDSQTFFDSHWDTAHLLVLLSYFFPIFGIWGETIKLHRYSQLQVIELVKEVTRCRQMEATLCESEERFRVIASNTPDHILVQDNELRYTFVINPQLRLTQQDMMGKTDYDFLTKEEADKLTGIKRQVIEAGEPRHLEMSLISKDGKPEFFDGTYIPRFDVHGKANGLMGYFRNVTKSKLMEESLKINEALFRQYYDNMKSGSAIFSVINNGSKASDYIIKKINTVGLKMEGKTLEDVVGKRFIDIRPTIDSYGLIPVMKKVWETGESAIFPTRIYIDERYSNYYENYVFKLPSGEIVTLYDDVTEIKRVEEELLLEKENFRHSLDDSPLGVRITSAEGNTIYANKTILNFYGYDSLGELQRTPLKNLYTPQSYVQAQERKLQRERGDFSTTNYEINIVSKNGEIRHLQVFRKEVLWDGISQFQVIYNDITDRKRDEETIRILARFPSENPDPVLRVDQNGRLLYANEASYKLLTWKLQIGEKTPSVLQKIITEAMKEGIGKQINTKHRQRIFTFNVVPVMEAGYANFYGQDITLHKQADEENRKSNLLLEDLHKHLNEIRENERASISREIHDQIGQSLTALKLDMNLMRKYINTNPEAVTKLESMVELISDTIKDVQRISSELRPGILDELGLVSAIEWYCDEFEKRTGIKSELELGNPDLSDSKISLSFFRALQETLTNVIRHARASSVNIKLKQSLKGTTLTIHDNGIGITKEQIESYKSLGLISMRERVKQFNGTIDISSKKGNGTKLIIFIPS